MHTERLKNFERMRNIQPAEPVLNCSPARYAVRPDEKPLFAGSTGYLFITRKIVYRICEAVGMDIGIVEVGLDSNEAIETVKRGELFSVNVVPWLFDADFDPVPYYIHLTAHILDKAVTGSFGHGHEFAVCYAYILHFAFPEFKEVSTDYDGNDVITFSVTDEYIREEYLETMMWTYKYLDDCKLKNEIPGSLPDFIKHMRETM